MGVAAVSPCSLVTARCRRRRTAEPIVLASRPHRRPTSARPLLHRRSATSVSTTARASQSCRPYPAITRPTIETIIRQQTSANPVSSGLLMIFFQKTYFSSPSTAIRGTAIPFTGSRRNRIDRRCHHEQVVDRGNNMGRFGVTAQAEVILSEINYAPSRMARTRSSSRPSIPAPARWTSPGGTGTGSPSPSPTARSSPPAASWWRPLS